MTVPTLVLSHAELFMCARAIRVMLTADEAMAVEASAGVREYESLPGEVRRAYADLKARLEGASAS